jgi:acetyl-CoA synthase
MSKIICSAAIRGAHKIVDMAEEKFVAALKKHGPEQEVAFPNTAYYLPVIYSMLGAKVQCLGDMKDIFTECRTLLPPLVSDHSWLPYLAPALDAGMATFFAEEMYEAVRYLEQPDFYTKTEETLPNNLWLGAADDVIFRKRGVEFVDGTAPGFAAIMGTPANKEVASKIALELQEKNLYIFMHDQDQNCWWRSACRSAGAPVWFLLARAIPRRYSPSALPVASPSPSAASSPAIIAVISSTTKTGPLPLSWPSDR